MKGTPGELCHDDVMKWKQFSRYWPFVRGIHWSPLNSPYKGKWRGALMFSLICGWINDWANNREAGDLRRHRGYYDATVMVNTVTVFTLAYGSVLVSWCAKNRLILTAPEHLLTAPEDLWLFRKTYNCYGRLITVLEELLTAPEQLCRELVCITVKWTWYNGRDIFFHITSGRINTCKGVNQLKELFFLNLIIIF